MGLKELEQCGMGGGVMLLMGCNRSYEVVKVNHGVVHEAWLWMADSRFSTLYHYT